jgi:hypothetical protein
LTNALLQALGGAPYFFIHVKNIAIFLKQIKYAEGNNHNSLVST